MRKFFLNIIFMFTFSATYGLVELASVFGDHMVLQQGMPVPVWGRSASGEKISIEFNGQRKTISADSHGNWTVKLSAMKAGGPYKMEVKGSTTVVVNDIYIGEVWLCSGQSNMDMTVAKEDRYWCGVINEKEEVATANYPLIRIFDVAFNPTNTIQDTVSGQWEICSPQSIGHLSAAAYFFARDLYNKYKFPIGLITTAFGASTAEAWTSNAALQAHPQLVFLLEQYKKKLAVYDTSRVARAKYDKALEEWKTLSTQAKAEGNDAPRKPRNPDPEKDQHSPYVLYNGMVAPLVPYAIRGAIWYQGESNGPTAAQYDVIMETLINDWRKAWQQGDFPFLYVQLANHQALIKDPVKDDAMVLVREGQLKNLSVVNTGMVVAIDNADSDDPGNIHPKNKQEIGRRLALLARALAYKDKIVYSGPVYKGMAIEKNVIRIQFKYADSGLQLKTNADSLSGFAIAGADNKFVWGNAEIQGSTLLISNPDVPNPKVVRYAWAKNPPVSLYNKEGLPASPFRTDIK